MKPYNLPDKIYVATTYRSSRLPDCSPKLIWNDLESPTLEDLKEKLKLLGSEWGISSIFIRCKLTSNLEEVADAS